MSFRGLGNRCKLVVVPFFVFLDRAGHLGAPVTKEGSLSYAQVEKKKKEKKILRSACETPLSRFRSPNVVQRPVARNADTMGSKRKRVRVERKRNIGVLLGLVCDVSKLAPETARR